VIASETVMTGGLSTTTTSAAALIPARARLSRVSSKVPADGRARPALTSRSPGTSVGTATSSSDALPASNSARPGRSPAWNPSLSDGLRRSASTTITDSSALAMAVARLIATLVRPSPARAPATSSTGPPSLALELSSGPTRARR
jgi:hypothetical protein